MASMTPAIHRGWVAAAWVRAAKVDDREDIRLFQFPRGVSRFGTTSVAEARNVPTAKLFHSGGWNSKMRRGSAALAPDAAAAKVRQIVNGRLR